MNFYILDHEATILDIGQFHFPNQKIGVIAHIETEDGKILLQQRGKKSRDENNRYEDIGGEVEHTDKSFRDAIVREIREEVGNDIQYQIVGSKAIGHWQKKDINWIFIIYSIKYLSGKLQIMEPEKCLGFRFFEKEEALNSKNVTESCKFIIRNWEK